MEVVLNYSLVGYFGQVQGLEKGGDHDLNQEDIRSVGFFAASFKDKIQD